MSDEPVRYCGTPIDTMTIEELRAALAVCIRESKASSRLHQELIDLLRNTIEMDNEQQKRLFLEYAR